MVETEEEINVGVAAEVADDYVNLGSERVVEISSDLVNRSAVDQLDISKAKCVDAKTLNFFNWDTFGSNFASLTTLTIFAYIQ